MVDDSWLNWDYINYCEPPHSWMHRNIGRNIKIIRKEQPKTYRPYAIRWGKAKGHECLCDETSGRESNDSDSHQQMEGETFVINDNPWKKNNVHL